jgi:uncharacterized protein (TIRG00374 family)
VSAADRGPRDEGAGESPEVAPTRGLARRVALGTVFGVLVLAALSLYGDVSDVASHLSTFTWSAFALALALSSSNYALRFVRWQHYLRALGIEGIPRDESALVFMSGFVMSVTPGKLGEVFKSFLLWESRGISLARTAPIVIAERLTDLLALVVLTTIGSLVLERGAAVAILGAVLVGLVVAAVTIRPIGELLLAIASRLPLLSRATPRLREAYESLRVLCGPVSLVLSTALATLSWGLECVALWILVHGFAGAGISLEGATLAYSASTIAGALAMLPGGLGVTEAGMTGLLQVVGSGIDASIATGATLLIRLATLWWAVLLGAIALAIHRARARR